MQAKRKQSLLDELNAVAFARPTKEDFVDSDLEAPPVLSAEDGELPPIAEEGKARGVHLLRGPLELEGEVYSGAAISQKDLFDDDSLSESSADLLRTRQFESERDSSRDDESGSVHDLYEEYDRIQSDVGLADLRLRAEKDQQQGRAVLRDKRSWKSCLELRVTLQKGLEKSHRLPFKAYRAQLLSTSPDLAAKCAAAQEAAGDVLKQLMELEDVRLERSKRQRSAEDDKRSGSEADSLWASLEDRFQLLRVFCQESLDRFHRQAMLQSGATTGKGSLSALHQGISAQVRSIMQTPRKALLRCCMPLSEQPRILGVPFHTADPPAAAPVNEEMYADTDFYQILLNEYLHSQGMDPLPLKRKRTCHGESQKRMKLVFSQVQEKLINFMIPTDFEQPVFAKQLFRNLFGQSHHD